MDKEDMKDKRSTRRRHIAGSANWSPWRQLLAAAAWHYTNSWNNKLGLSK